MKVIGIIAEYNPFHNGHAYQIARIREETNADCIAVAMSGDFVQRGAPSVIDKYTRTKMALTGGADVVLELPTLWATASAESFAMAGVTLFEKMGCVDGICFGAESGNLPLLSQIAALLAEEPQEYRHALSSYLKSGQPFPAARAKAICDFLTQKNTAGQLQTLPAKDTLAAILHEPNNILAIEYLKALKRRSCALTPHLLVRTGAGYHEAELRKPTASSCGSLDSCTPAASATAIRRILLQQPASDASPAALLPPAGAMPDAVLEILSASLADAPCMCEDDFSDILGYLLFTQSKDSLAAIGDCNEEIANRIFKSRYHATSFSALCALTKSRDVTYTRMQRILTHLLLAITNSDYAKGRALDYIPYLRILGFRRSGAPLLRTLKKSAAVPVIGKLADAPAILSPAALDILQKDIFAAELYELILSQKAKKTTSRSEYTREIVLL